MRRRGAVRRDVDDGVLVRIAGAVRCVVAGQQAARLPESLTVGHQDFLALLDPFVQDEDANMQCAVLVLVIIKLSVWSFAHSPEIIDVTSLIAEFFCVYRQIPIKRQDVITGYRIVC